MNQNPLLQRIQLNNEWHARPVADMATPCRCTHQVFRRATSTAAARNAFAHLCLRHGQSAPAPDSRHHVAQLGAALIKWEGHTEADSLTCLVPGNGTPLFSEAAGEFAPADLTATLGEDVVCGVQIEVIRQSREAMDLEFIRATLGTNDIYGGPIADGCASLWSGFRLDPQGFSRIIMVDHDLPAGAAGRYLQRIVESESYRMQAMQALPLARDTMAELSQLEDTLEPLMDRLGQTEADTDHEGLLMKLSTMAARVEHLAAASSYRFAAARAYARLVEQRLLELREERVLTQPRYSVFLLRSLQPAMRTCEAAERRIEELAQRVARALTLLNSMVDMLQTRQSNAMMHTMSRNAAIQVRLQQAVEGFSTFVISYYALGILGYVLNGAHDTGLLAWQPKIILAVTAPLMLASVWLLSRWVRRRLTREIE